MKKAVLVMDMPNCCDECFALDDNGDYPLCLITREQRGYTFRTRELKMDRCPLKEMPEKKEIAECYTQIDYAYRDGWNNCLNKILGEV